MVVTASLITQYLIENGIGEAVLSPNGLILHASPNLHTLFRFERLPKRNTDLIAQGFRKMTLDGMEQAIETGNPYYIERPILSKPDEILKIITVPIRNPASGEFEFLRSTVVPA